MFESMVLKVITFFVDVGDWFKKNFLPHNPHSKEEKPEFVGEFMIQAVEATPEVKTAKEFMQQSIETVSKAEEDLKARIIEDVKQVEDVVAKYKAELVEVIKEENLTAAVENISEVVADVAEVVEETAKKVKKTTRKKTKTEED